MQLYLLWTDILFLLMIFCLVISIINIVKNKQKRNKYRLLFNKPIRLVSLIILLLYIIIAILDSVHFLDKSSDYLSSFLDFIMI